MMDCEREREGERNEKKTKCVSLFFLCDSRKTRSFSSLSAF